MDRVLLPRRLDSISSLQRCGLTELNFEPSDCVCIVFSQCEFFEPFPLLYLGNRILELKELYPETNWKIDRAPTSFDGFAAHIGFFDYIGGAKFLGPRLGEAQGSSRYVPIKIIDIEEVRDTASTAFAGPSRPTYCLFKGRGFRLESHPIRRWWPNWAQYPHWHYDRLGKWVKQRHFPLIEPLAAIISTLMTDGCCNDP